jgi:hypothetical protein
VSAAERRLAAVAGLLGIALAALAVSIDRMWTFPTTGSSAAEIAGYAGTNRSALLIAMLLTTLGVVLWLPFGAGAWQWLRDGDRGESLLATSFLAGLVVFVALLLAGFSAFVLLVYRAPLMPDPKLLYDLSFALLAISGVPTALAMGAFAGLVLTEPGLPSWTAWPAGVAGVAHLLLPGSLIVGSGFFSLEGGVTIAVPATLFAWIVATSAAMLADRRPGHSALHFERGFS